MIPANKRLCEREPDLPGLSLLLDPAELGSKLGLGPLSIEYLRLKPGTSCTASYRAGDHWLVAKAVTPSRLDELGNSGRTQNKLVIWHGIAVKISPPTADRRMPGLSKALDERSSRQFLNEMRELTRIRFDRLTTLKFKPQKRLVAMLSQNDEPRALLKIHAADYHSMALIAATTAQQLGGPQLLYANSHSGIILTEWINGEALGCGRLTDMQAAAAGRKLAGLHEKTVALPMEMSRRNEIRAAGAVMRDCAKLLPQLKGHLVDIGPRLQDILLSHPSEYGLVHGDFSPDQIIHDAGEVHIIDWDRACIGDQANDTGSFLASLSKAVLDGDLTEDRAYQLEDAFLAGYGEVRPVPPATHAQRLRHLTLLLTEDFRSQENGWDQKIAALLSHIHHLSLQTAKGVLEYPDPEMPEMANMLYLAGIQRLLGDHPYRLTAPAILFRHKYGRRAIAELPAEPGPLIAKINQKGLDQRITQLHDQLRHAGFDGTGPDAIEVPEILGIDKRLGLTIAVRLPGDLVMSEGFDDQEALMRTGRALARLHLTGIDPERVWSNESEARVLRDAMAQASSLRPANARELSRIASRAARALDQLPPVKPVLLHRDFYQDQVLVTADKLSLLDLDLAALGDSAVDLGNFIAHLRELALRKHGDAAFFTAQEGWFLDGYRQIRPQIDLPRTELMAQISLARHLFICLRIQQRRPIFERLLNLSIAASQKW